MYLNEQVIMYQLAYQLAENNQFEVIHIDSTTNEIWLERYQNKKSKVIRVIQKGFDWKNDLKKDIGQILQIVRANMHLFTSKNVEFHNIYVSEYPPVDDWEDLKKTMQLKDDKSFRIKNFYLSKADYQEEISRMQTAIDVNLKNIFDPNDSEEDKERKVNDHRLYLSNSLQERKKEVENVFSFGKPFFTYILIVINILVFILLEISGGSTNTFVLIEHGAKYNPAIMDGAWWRLISSMFLHIGILHLFMNMLAAYYLGTVVERIYGSWRFLLIYFLSGIGGGIASFALSPNVSAGASGAIFGLFGALLFFGLIYRRIFLKTMGSGVLLVVGINLVFGFFFPQIDMAAHVIGLLTGFIASAIVYLPTKKNILVQITACFVFIFVIFGFAVYGTNANENSQSYQLMRIDELIYDNNYEEVIDTANLALTLEGDLEGPILFQRAYAYMALNEWDQAIQDLEVVVEQGETIPQAYYNLGLLYFYTGQHQKAEEAITQAAEMKPDDEQFRELYEKITG